MRRPPQILFAHDAWPGQFGGLAGWMAGAGWDVWAVSATGTAGAGLRLLRYAPHRAPSPATHPFAQPLDRAMLTGQAAAKACLAAQSAGLAPDLIVSHTGPGTGLCLGALFPRAVQIAYCEWWYQAPGIDTAFMAEQEGRAPPDGPDARALEMSRNAPIAQELLAAGRGLCPTAFQAAQFPAALRGLLTLRPDGVDCARFSPGPPGPPGPARHKALAGLAPEVPVLSYATRGMEPHRGFAQAMAAFAEVQARVPQAVAVIAGGAGVHYGDQAARRVDWKAQALATTALDPARTLFTGMLAPDDYLWLLRRSNAHLYATVPFVLSWSMREAMATGTPLVLSDTAPVREFADERCARMVPFGDVGATAEALVELLAAPDAARARGQAARARILAHCDARRVYPETAQWLAGLVEGARPAAA